MGTEDQLATVTAPEKSKLHQLFTGPWMGVMGIVGVLLSIYAIYDAKQTPDLSYYVFTTQPVVASDRTSKLAVTYDGQPVVGDVSAAYIVFWNAGKKAIRASDMRDKITITVGGDLEILEAKMGSSRLAAKKAEEDARRKIVGVLTGGAPVGAANSPLIAMSEVAKGTASAGTTGHSGQSIGSTPTSPPTISDPVRNVLVEIDVLEKDEWITIGLIYKGKPSETIRATASLVGQKEITRYDIIRDERGNFRAKSWFEKVLVFVYDQQKIILALLLVNVMVAAITLRVLLKIVSGAQFPKRYKTSALKIANYADLSVRLAAITFALMTFSIFLLVQRLPSLPPDL